MKIRKKNEEFVKVSIGQMNKNDTGYGRPIKTILLDDTTIEEVYNKIMEKVVCLT